MVVFSDLSYEERKRREKIHKKMARDLRRTQLLLKKKRERGS
jgi:uncharacterized protein YbaA (DUF1428 family)